MKITAASPVLEGYGVQECSLGHVEGSGFDPLPVVRWDEGGVFLSRHVLDEEARRVVAETGEIYVYHLTVNKRFIPVRLSAERPEVPVTRLACYSFAGDGLEPRVFDGFEVRDAGGSEEERLDYARSEAAEEGAAAAQLPARIALLAPGVDWMEGGGEPCASAAALEAAITKRLARLKGQHRVEVRDARGLVFVFTLAEVES